MRSDLTAERLRLMLDYDQQTGVFTWKEKPSKQVIAGAEAGHLQADQGYVVIKIRGVLHKAHRLAWLHVTGRWPAGVIDHRNGNKSDNSFTKLRDTTRAVNQQNQIRAHKNSSTGLLGVARDGDRYSARIRVHGRLRTIGRYSTPELAHAAYMVAKRELHPAVFA